MQGPSKRTSRRRRPIGNGLLLSKRKACSGKIGAADLYIMKNTGSNLGEEIRCLGEGGNIMIWIEFIHTQSV